LNDADFSVREGLNADHHLCKKRGREEGREGGREGGRAGTRSVGTTRKML
jgi:hypothetical protein